MAIINPRMMWSCWRHIWPVSGMISASLEAALQDVELSRYFAGLSSSDFIVFLLE